MQPFKLVSTVTHVDFDKPYYYTCAYNNTIAQHAFAISQLMHSWSAGDVINSSMAANQTRLHLAFRQIILSSLLLLTCSKLLTCSMKFTWAFHLLYCEQQKPKNERGYLLSMEVASYLKLVLTC